MVCRISVSQEHKEAVLSCVFYGGRQAVGATSLRRPEPSKRARSSCMGGLMTAHKCFYRFPRDGRSFHTFRAYSPIELLQRSRQVVKLYRGP